MKYLTFGLLPSNGIRAKSNLSLNRIRGDQVGVGLEISKRKELCKCDIEVMEYLLKCSVMYVSSQIFTPLSKYRYFTQIGDK